MKLSIFFTGILFFCLFTVSCPAGELKKIKFLPMWYSQVQFAGYYLAKEKGIYEKYGLDVTILTGGYKQNLPEMLGKGDVHFGIMPLLTAINENFKGMKFVNIAQIFQKNSLEFVAGKETGIDSLSDFNGKRIAVSKTLFKEESTEFLRRYGIKATIYPVNNGVDLFLKKAVDICSVMHYNGYNALINYGVNPDELSFFKLSDFDMDFPEDGIYCRSETYNSDPKLCRAFVNASIKGWEYALRNPLETIALVKGIGLNTKEQWNKARAEWMISCMRTIIHPSGKNVPIGRLRESDYDNAVNFILQNNHSEQKLPFGEFYRGTR